MSMTTFHDPDTKPSAESRRLSGLVAWANELPDTAFLRTKDAALLLQVLGVNVAQATLVGWRSKRSDGPEWKKPLRAVVYPVSGLRKFAREALSA